MTVDITPVQKSIRVPCEPQVAFRVFTEKMATWWPLASHSVGGEKAIACGIDPRVGGEVYEVDDAGKRSKWGTVKTWEPPNRVVFDWHPGRDESGATLVSVTFTAAGDGTEVALTHDEWWKLGDQAREMRDNYDSGWEHIFSILYRGACEAATK